MGWNDPDPYCQPEKFGLTIVDELHDPDSCYDYDDLCVWRHDDGRLFYAVSSGCSCTSPFEDVAKLDDLTPITDESWDEFWSTVMEHCAWRQSDDEFACEKNELLGKVMALRLGKEGR